MFLSNLVFLPHRFSSGFFGHSLHIGGGEPLGELDNSTPVLSLTDTNGDSGWIKLEQDGQTNGQSSDDDLQWSEFLDNGDVDDFASFVKRVAALKEKYPDEYITIDTEAQSVHTDSTHTDR